MNNLLTQKFPIAAFVLLFVLTLSCSHEPAVEPQEPGGTNVAEWNDSAFNGDAVMGEKMMFRVGDSLQVIRKASTRLSTAFDGQNYTLSGDERITIAMKRGSESEAIKIYKVKDADTGALEYEKDADNNVTEPFYWKSTTETVKLRAWSYGTSEAYTSDPLTTPFTLNTTQTELVVGKDNYRELLYDKQRDYPYAANITLNLYHQLARITVELTHSDNEKALSIAANGVTIGGGVLPTSAQFVAPTGDSNIGSWEDLQNNSGTVTARTDVANQKYSAVVFPKTYSAGTKIVGVTTTAESPWNSYAYTLPSGGEELEAGKQYSYTVNVRDLVLVSGLTVSDIAAVTYNGSAQTPEPTVTDPVSGKVLTKGTHYILEYDNNINAGTATCTVKGQGIYSGTQSKNFTINVKALSASELKFESSAVTRTYIWEIGTGTNALTKPNDCTVTYTSDNTAVASVSDAATGTLLPGGTLNTNATITATATGNYSGTATYTIKATSKEKSFSYINNTIQSETVCKGTYQLEVWGAEGGASISAGGGRGGYSNGNVILAATTNLYIVVGGKGANSTQYSSSQYISGGYNGGGHGGSNDDTTWGGGGGATHIAKQTGLLKELKDFISDILIVAGGGGGGGYCRNKGNYTGGTGGGESGGNGTGSRIGAGGNQSEGGTSQDSGAGSFGQGGEGSNSLMNSGGGGGYYGGGSACRYGSSAGGGSGYIGGVSTPKETIAGNSSFPAPGGGNETGHGGDGYARITWVSN